MVPQTSPATRVVFGPYAYESVTGDLWKHGNRLRLQGQPLHILELLLEHAGEVVGRERLQRRIWSGAGFGDFEHGLNAAVNKLRQALGDSADRPRYVETVPGRGYRFIAPVQRISAGAVRVIATPAALRVEPVRSRRGGLWLPWLAGAALIGAGAGGYWLGTRGGGQALAPTPVRFTVVPPSGFVLEAASSRQAFALAPDGERLAFTAMNASGEFSVFLRNFSALEPRLVPVSQGAHTLFWAPDSQSLFLTVRGTLRRTALESDSYVVIGNSPARVFYGAAFRSDQLLVGGPLTTHLISASGGTTQALAEEYRWPQVLPGGERILHVVWDERAGRFRARVTRFDEPGSGKDLIEADSRVMYAASAVTPGKGYLVYVRAGALVARPFDPDTLRVTGEARPIVSKVTSFRPTGAADFSVSENGALAYQSHASRFQLAWVDRRGRQISTIGPAEVNVKSAWLSPDGKKLATAIYDIERGGQNLRVLDTKTGAGRLLVPKPGLRDAPVWAPDSSRIAFLNASGDKPPVIHIRGVGEKDPESALPADEFQIPTDWSPDGRFVAFTKSPRFANETQSDVWVADLANNQKLWPVLNTAFQEANGRFSPDGKWLAFTSDESGRAEVYIQSFTAAAAPAVSGERYPVSRSGALALRWRRDGKELFYLGFDGRIHAVPMHLSRKPEFGPDTALFGVSTEARAAAPSVVGFDVSADGQRFVVPVVTSPESSSLIVVRNWEAELRR